MGVCTNSSNIQTDILPEALYDITEIHTGHKVRERRMKLKRESTSLIQRRCISAHGAQRFVQGGQYVFCHRGRPASVY